MTMIGKVLPMHWRENKSVQKVVKSTSLARNMVRKPLCIDKGPGTKGQAT